MAESLPQKRPIDAAADPSGIVAIVKKAKATQEASSAIVAASAAAANALLPSHVKRTSSLPAPILQMSGHDAEVFACRFSPNGQTIASASADRRILLWKTSKVTAEPGSKAAATDPLDAPNYATLKGHSGAILEISWSADGSRLFSSSVDKTGAIWDVHRLERLKKLRGHNGIVNACVANRDLGDHQLVATGADDGFAKVWDVRQRAEISQLPCQFPVTAVAFSHAGDLLFTGGIDNAIKAFDLRQPEQPLYTMAGHTDTITGLSLSPDGAHLLSNAMDNTVRMWDVRPFAIGTRNSKTYQGAVHNFEKNLLRCSWNHDGTFIAAGSADRFVYIWNVGSQEIAYKLPGHAGSVNDVQFHPLEPIVLSCSSDRKMFLGEIEY